jgi:hypothetical protein
MRGNIGSTLPIEITAQRTLPATLETKLTVGERPSDPRQVGHDKDLGYGSLEDASLGGSEVMRVRTSDNDTSFVVRLEGGELPFSELHYTTGEFTAKLTPVGDQYVATEEAPLVEYMRANVGNTLDIKISDEPPKETPKANLTIGESSDGLYRGFNALGASYGYLDQRIINGEDVVSLRTTNLTPATNVMMQFNSPQTQPFQSVTLNINGESYLLERSQTYSMYEIESAELRELFDSGVGETFEIEIIPNKELDAQFTIGKDPAQEIYGFVIDAYGSITPDEMQGQQIISLRTFAGGAPSAVIMQFNIPQDQPFDNVMLNISGNDYLFKKEETNRYQTDSQELRDLLEQGEGQTYPIKISEPIEPTIQKELIAISRGGEQPRNDYEYLVNYLAPNPRVINITYTEG